MAIKTREMGAVLAFLCLLPFNNAAAQTFSESYNQIRSAIDAGETKHALSRLATLRDSNAALFAANNLDYLQARLSDASGESHQAVSAYQSVVARGSILSAHALWHLSQSARAIGDLVLERERLRQLILLSPASVLRETATLRLGESFFESGDYANAIPSLEQLGKSKTVTTARKATLLIGQSYLRQNKQESARAVFSKLIMQMPDASRPDDFALAAVRALDQMEAGAGEPKSKTSLPQAEHLLRASIYQFNRDFAAARSHFLAVIEQNPHDASAANALYQLGRGLYLEGKYGVSINYFQRVLDEFPDSTAARDALASLAASFIRLKRLDDGISSYRRFADQFPDAPNPERSYLNIIDALHEAGRHSEGLNWIQQTRARFKNGPGDVLALFAQLRIHLAQQGRQAAMGDVDELLRMGEVVDNRAPGGTNRAELLFLHASVLEQLGRTDEAVSGYLSVPEGRNEYYGSRATQRLRALSGDEKTRGLVETRFSSVLAQAKTALAQAEFDRARGLSQAALRLTDKPTALNEVREIIRQTYSYLAAYQLPSFKLIPEGRREPVTIADSAQQDGQREPTHQRIADELLFLGLFDEAVPELLEARAMGANATQPAASRSMKTAGNVALSDSDYTLAVDSLRGGFANRAVRFAEQVWRNVPTDYVIELAPRELVEMLYPIPFRESFLQHATSRNIDPRFVLSIARQESRFQVDAKSVAAARGMMQFIPATANEIARELGRNSFDDEELYNPDMAIQFGAQYLSNLFKQFSNQPQAVAAAYNGGPDNIARWIARSRSSDPDRYVLEIGFSQTKDYVYTVLNNFWTYEELYDSQLRRKSPH